MSSRTTETTTAPKEPTTETQEMRLDTTAAAAAPEKETKGLTQGQIVRKRFMGNTGAIVSLVVLALIVLLAYTSIGFGPIPGWWKYDYSQMDNVVNGGHPTLSLTGLGDHPFGQDTTGRDLFAMTMRGTQTSIMVIVIVGVIAGLLGVVIGGLSGYFRGWTEAVLMRMTDVVIIFPLIVLTAVLGQLVISRIPMGPGRVIALAVLIGLASWTGLARLVRGEFLTLREREFVDAARLAGASSGRIIFKHILPNAVGVITVNVTMLMASAILIETSLSYVGYGVQAPDVSLGKLISDNQSAFSTRSWLFWWPGLFIVAICLCINFIGDGLRDAFDPRQKKFNPKKARTRTAHSAENGLDASGAAAIDSGIVRGGADPAGDIESATLIEDEPEADPAESPLKQDEDRGRTDTGRGRTD